MVMFATAASADKTLSLRAFHPRRGPNARLRRAAATCAGLAVIGLTIPALAQERHRPWVDQDIHRFHERDFNHWRAGNWQHGRHDGRVGWWWVVGGVWYFYPAPVYPFPDPYVPPAPPPVVITPPPQFYLCESPRGYYPYVPSCPGGWRVVPATPP
jgi:hypothetical protein